MLKDIGRDGLRIWRWRRCLSLMQSRQMRWTYPRPKQSSQALRPLWQKMQDEEEEEDEEKVEEVGDDGWEETRSNERLLRGEGVHEEEEEEWHMLHRTEPMVHF